jgi:hypothetical protein
VGLALAQLATPKGAFGGSGLDARYALPSAALALLSLEGAIRRRQALALAVIALLAVRHLAVLRSWSALSPDVAANVTLLKVVSEQSAIAVDFTADDRNRDTEKRTSVLKHVASYATVIRQAVTSNAFTNRNSSWIEWRPRSTTAETSLSPEPRCDRFDFVWTFGAPPDTAIRLQSVAELVAASGSTKIWRCNAATAPR